MILACNLQTGPLMSNQFLIPNSGKDFIIKPIVVPETLGGVSNPQDTIKLSEKEDAINH